MIYFLLVVAMGLTALVALICFIVAIVQAFRARWKAAAAWVVMMIFCIIGTAATGVYFVARGASDTISALQRKAEEIKAKEAERMQRIAAHSQALAALTPDDPRAGQNKDFFNSDGGGDWKRRPVRFPYAVRSFSELDKGWLVKDAGSSNIEAGDAKILLDKVTRYSFDKRMFLCLLEDAGVKTWIIYHFDTDAHETFATEAEMLDAASTAGFAGPLPLRSVKEQHADYWN